LFRFQNLTSLVKLRKTRRTEPPGVLLMTGVHWLLAHCSVLKVRAPCLRALSCGNKKPPALTADGTWRPRSSDRLRQMASLPCSIVRKMAPMQDPLLGLPRNFIMVRPNQIGRQQSGSRINARRAARTAAVPPE
jgi:hypothetical protein